MEPCANCRKLYSAHHGEYLFCDADSTDMYKDRRWFPGHIAEAIHTLDKPKQTELPPPQMIWVADEESGYKSYKTGVYFAKDIVPILKQALRERDEAQRELASTRETLVKWDNELVATNNDLEMLRHNHPFGVLFDSLKIAQKERGEFMSEVAFTKAELAAANRRADEAEKELLEMTKLCHQYQDQLWTKDKEKLENESRTRD